jgi:hypothetical protein
MQVLISIDKPMFAEEEADLIARIKLVLISYGMNLSDFTVEKE